jgi:hypothetical protein
MDVEVMETTANPEATRLTASLHAAQAQGLLREPNAVRQLLAGIAGAIIRTVEGNARDPETCWALRSQVYWDHFEMDIKETLFGAFFGLEPALCEAARTVVDTTLAALKNRYHHA